MRVRFLRLGALVTLGLAACTRPSPPGPAPTAVSSGDAASSGADDAGSASSIDASAAGSAASPASAASADSGARSDPKTDPFGVLRTAARASCGVLGEGHVSERDTKSSFVDGDDLLAIVNRSPTGQLAPDYAPHDLVDIRNGKPLVASDCEKFQCLRRDAASALDELLARMKKAGFPGKVESAFRSYGSQCGTFGNWSRKSSFCEATEQSALPGHSQHQLGTTVDLFSEEWAKDERGVFREGFGCTDAGRWLREHVVELGFVMPYPIHPDDRHPRQRCTARWDIPVNINPRTGYRFEHWHIRYIGRDEARRFAEAQDRSGIGKPTEMTLEQWLRSEKGISGADAELPVCDGCNCGACSTLASAGESSCDRKGGAIHLDDHGLPIVVGTAPTIESAARGKPRKWRGRLVEVKLEVPVGTSTQPPIAGLDAAGYSPGATFERLSPYPETEPRAYPPLANAWTVAVEPIPNDTGVDWPYRAALASSSVGSIYNRANVLLPTRGGKTLVRIPLPSSVRKAKVSLVRGGAPQGREWAVDLE